MNVMTFKDIVIEGLRRCAAGEMTATVAHDLARCDIEVGVSQHLLGLGIARVLNDALAEVRDRQGGTVEARCEPEALAGRPVAALNPNASKMLRMYASADGMRKTLLAFTVSDWVSFRGQALNEEAAWGRLASAATLAIEALTRTGMKTTGDLPKKDLAIILEALP